jgi:hypothetical protein
MSQQVIPLNIEKCELTKTGASFPVDLSPDDWREIGRKLAVVESCHKWLLGDWLNFGEKAYGEKYVEATRISEYEATTLRNMAYVCSQVEMSRRSDKLSFAHHYEVADLGSKEQEQWLSMAEQGKWSVMEMRAEMRKANSQYGSEDHGKPVSTFKGWFSQGVRLFNQRIQKQPIDEWTGEEKALFKKELQPFVEIYQQL